MQVSQCERQFTTQRKIFGAQEIKVEDRLEESNPSHIEHQLDSLGNDSTDYLENDSRLKEVPGFVVSGAECLFNLSAFSNISKAENIIFSFDIRGLISALLEITFQLLRTATGLQTGCCSKLF